MLELEQYAQDIVAIRKSILASGEALHIDHMKEQIDELTEEMNQPEFWNDTERSTKVNQKLGHLKNKLAHYEGLLQAAEDIDTMMELAREENDEDMVQEIGEELARLKEQADALELETLMRGDYDDCDDAEPACRRRRDGSPGLDPDAVPYVYPLLRADGL